MPRCKRLPKAPKKRVYEPAPMPDDEAIDDVLSRIQSSKSNAGYAIRADLEVPHDDDDEEDLSAWIDLPSFRDQPE